MSDTKYIIGADGGGTKTAFVLMKGKEEIAKITLGASNPTDIGREASAALLKKGCQSLCEQCKLCADDISAIFTGVAGGSAVGYAEFVEGELSKAFPHTRIKAGHDAFNLLYAAFPDRDGAVVICGTGSSCFVKTGEKITRIGGYSVFDIKGNGYEIGKRAVGHALACCDGQKEPDLLSEKVINALGAKPLDILTELLNAGKGEIAKLSVPVFQAYDEGCESAKAILYDNLEAIALLINTAGKLFDGEFEVCAAGGVFKNPQTLKILAPMLSKSCKIFLLDKEPVYGAAAKAMSMTEK